MKLARILIDNYRSIKTADIPVSAFSVLVGQNNHGKTNVFEAVHWFYTAKTTIDEEYHCKDNDYPVVVQLEFCDVTDDDIEKLSSEGAKTKIRTLLGDAKHFSVRKSSATHKRTYLVEGVDKGNPTGLDTAINEFIPRLEYVSTKIRLDDVARYKDRNPIGSMLSGVLTTIVETSAEYAQFRSQFSNLFEGEQSEVRAELNKLGSAVEIYLKKQFPDGTRVSFTVNPPLFTDLLKSFETSVDDGIETTAGSKGDGMQRAIMLSIIQAFADFRRAQSAGSSFLFLIDEAELHLHPTAQRALKYALLDISITDQVLINTHSSVLLADADSRQKVFCVEKFNRVTRVEEVAESKHSDIIFELLGGSPSDLLLPRNFLIVEGKSEFEFIKRIIDRFYAEELKGIQVIFGGGDLTEQEKSMIAVHKVLVPLVSPDKPIYKNSVVVLIDKPNDAQQSKYILFKQGYPYLFDEGRVFELPHCSLEECYPGPHGTTPVALGATGVSKVEYARTVAAALEQEEFESGMERVYAAIMKAKELAY